MTPERFKERFGHLPRCDTEQLAMLTRCSGKRDMSEWNEWRRQNPSQEIWLQGAELSQTYLQGADLQKTHLEGASLVAAHLEDARLNEAHLEDSVLVSSYLEHASLWVAHLESANLMGACLEDVQLRRAHLESTLFIGSSIDGKTLIAACFLDDKTNFTMTGLDSARIEPAMLTRLKTNIRRFEWKKWYRMRKSERYQMRKTESKASLFTPLLNKLLPSNTDCDHPFIILFMLPVLLFFFLLLAIPIWIIRDFDVTVLFIRLFWWISDYGSSTKRILKTFMIMVCAFTALYAGLEYCGFNVLEQTAFPMGTSLGSQFNWLATLFFFSFATMVTLGFGNINVVLNAPSSVLGMLLVAANLFTGYFLLAVLVTRIGILFQSLGPEAEVTKSKRKEASSKS